MLVTTSSTMNACDAISRGEGSALLSYFFQPFGINVLLFDVAQSLLWTVEECALSPQLCCSAPLKFPETIRSHSV